MKTVIPANTKVLNLYSNWEIQSTMQEISTGKQYAYNTIQYNKSLMKKLT